MPKSRPPHPAEFRQQLIEPVRAEKTPAQLSREFVAKSQTVRGNGASPSLAGNLSSLSLVRAEKPDIGAVGRDVDDALQRRHV
jgi:transposase